MRSIKTSTLIYQKYSDRVELTETFSAASLPVILGADFRSKYVNITTASDGWKVFPFSSTVSVSFALFFSVRVRNKQERRNREPPRRPGWQAREKRQNQEKANADKAKAAPAGPR